MWIISSDLPSYERYIENEGKLNNKKAMNNRMNIVEEPNIAKWFTLKKKWCHCYKKKGCHINQTINSFIYKSVKLNWIRVIELYK